MISTGFKIPKLLVLLLTSEITNFEAFRYELLWSLINISSFDEEDFNFSEMLVDCGILDKLIELITDDE